ncbi:tetratricopeptide repeat protein [Gilliamella sp. ESL0443]|uniref:YfgM family protein n=1 Tax=Gilliamella sp. ESL0443 TaxID=2704655 RepID=UPI001C6A61DC|nr:tetratricopeptide repeat protein [Gilliamella sp. ESL0443]QYN42885.1 tetratricopeptide repeat protein [Gilliamella sp. ESL0443]
MSYQLSGEEQVSEIKEFLAKTWKIIVAVIVIGLLAFYGWRYWQSYKLEKTIESSERYEQLIANLDKNKPDSVNELVSFAESDNTIYSVFANLKAAKFYVEELKDYPKAEKLLTDSLSKTDSEVIKSISYIRIARIQYQLERYQDVLATLNKVTEKSWVPVVNDIRGDAYMKLNNYAEAVAAYNVALAPAPADQSGENNSKASLPTEQLDKNIKMKLNQAQYLKDKQQAEQEAQDAKDKAKQEAEANVNAAQENNN